MLRALQELIVTGITRIVTRLISFLHSALRLNLSRRRLSLVSVINLLNLLDVL
jgi:hypothetical protein